MGLAPDPEKIQVDGAPGSLDPRRDPSRRAGKGGAVDDEDLLGALGHHLGHGVENPAADPHVVAAPDGHDLGHDSLPSTAAMSAAMASGARPAVSTTWVASRS